MNARIFPRAALTWVRRCPTLSKMMPSAQIVIVICIVAVSAAGVVALMALRRVLIRADSVLGQVERQIPPLMSQVDALSTDVRALLRSGNQELQRVSIVVHRVEDLTAKVGRLVATVTALTSVGQYASLAAGLKKGANVFVRRLRSKA